MNSRFLKLKLTGLAKGRAFIDTHQVSWVKEFIKEDGSIMSINVKMAGEMESFTVDDDFDVIAQAIDSAQVDTDTDQDQSE